MDHLYYRFKIKTSGVPQPDNCLQKNFFFKRIKHYKSFKEFPCNNVLIDLMFINLCEKYLFLRMKKRNDNLAQK